MPSITARVLFVRPACPECGMRMISVDGFTLDPECWTFECLRCGHIDTPQDRRAQAAE